MRHKVSLRRALKLGGLVCIVMQAAVVRAQSRSVAPIGSNIAKPIPPSTKREKVAMFDGFGKCVLRSHPEFVAKFVRYSDFRSVDEDAMGMKIEDFLKLPSVENCLTNEMSDESSSIKMTIRRSLMRSKFAEALYLQSHEQSPVLAPGSIEPVQRKYISTGDELGKAQGMAQFADCIVFADTQGADALLRTDPGSPKELAAARALAPILGKCLVEGQSLALTPTNIRSLAADGLWTRYSNDTAFAASDN